MIATSVTRFYQTQLGHQVVQQQSISSIRWISVDWRIANARRAIRRTSRSGIRSIWETSRRSSVSSVTRNSSHKRHKKRISKKETHFVSLRSRLVPGVILGVAIGLAIGVGAYTFVYARGYSYMTD